MLKKYGIIYIIISIILAILACIGRSSLLATYLFLGVGVGFSLIVVQSHKTDIDDLYHITSASTNEIKALNSKIEMLEKKIFQLQKDLSNLKG